LALKMLMSQTLPHLLDGNFLSPDPKRFGPSPSIADGAEAMTPRPEVTVDEGMRREEILRLVA
jgi:hypothetical protein